MDETAIKNLKNYLVICEVDYVDEKKIYEQYLRALESVKDYSDLYECLVEDFASQNTLVTAMKLCGQNRNKLLKEIRRIN